MLSIAISNGKVILHTKTKPYLPPKHKNLVFGGDGRARVTVAILPPSDHER
jgi:hypothetical protein